MALVLILSLMLPMAAIAEEPVEEVDEEVVIGEEVVTDDEATDEEEVTEEEPVEEAEETEEVEETEEAEEVEEEVTEEEVEEPVVKNATPTASKVLVNGVEVSFEAYLIDGFNYFKLRDLAQVVKGTEKQFEVSWDADNSIIVLTSNQEYTSQGVELTEGDGLEKEATLNNSKVMIDGVEVEFEAYTINGLNYFKLRDIAKAFDIGVTYNPETAEIGLDTTIGYTE